jgi:hypothetical protein
MLTLLLLLLRRHLAHHRVGHGHAWWHALH